MGRLNGGLAMSMARLTLSDNLFFGDNPASQKVRQQRDYIGATQQGNSFFMLHPFFQQE
jgi:hypothetical protein